MLTTSPAAPGSDIVFLIEAREAARSGRGAQLRRAAGLSQGEMAKALGLSGAAISRWEAGERRPAGDAAVAYARLLRAIAAELAFRSEVHNDVAPAGNGRDGKASDAGARPTD